MWNIIDSGKKNASTLMELDKSLLSEMKRDNAPIVHFYDFVKPSFTFGVFIKPEDIMNQKTFITDFDFSKRPTGGGVLFHIWDFAFSCFVPKNHPGFCDDVMDSYKYINNRVIDALGEFVKDKKEGFSLLPEEPAPLDEQCKHFCFAKPTKYDIMFGGKKIVGAAQRRKEEGYLHQGSISLFTPEFSVLEPLFSSNSKVLKAMNLHTFHLFDKVHKRESIDIRERIKMNLIDSLNKS